MKTNTAIKAPRTEEGGLASKIGPEQTLHRMVMCCLLFEDEFYVDGETIAAHIARLVPQCRPEWVAAVAFEARDKMYVRHVPLLLVREMARHPEHKKLVGKLLTDVIQRADEIAEFLAIYWKEGKQKVSNQVKKGLANAFLKFDAYQLAKWGGRAPLSGDGRPKVHMRDALFICHAKPEPETGGPLDLLVKGTLPAPATWESAMAAGRDMGEEFVKLMSERRLPVFAFVRNLRNMKEKGVPIALINDYARTLKPSKMLPFRFITADRHAPEHRELLEHLMMRNLEGLPKLKGKTVLLVDVSGSMEAALSHGRVRGGVEETNRIDAANGIAIMLREVAESVELYTFSTRTVAVAESRGFALADAIRNSQPHAGTYLAAAIQQVAGACVDAARLIVITDEQAHDDVRSGTACPGYIVNVATNEHGVGYKVFTHINGWSERVIDYIRAIEGENVEAVESEE